MLKKIFGLDQLIGLAMLTVLLTLSYLDPYPVKYIREKGFDTYQIIKPRSVPPAEDRMVTIIDIDEKSLQELGQWPWSRTIVAQLVANLHNMGVGVIAFDIVFPEADRLNPARLAETLAGIDTAVRDKILALESNDEIFSRIVAQTNVVLGRAGFWDRLPNDGGISPKRAIAIRKLSPDSQEATDFLVDTPTLISNLPLLEKNAKGIGTFAFRPMLDGIVRQIPLVIQHQGHIFPSLAVEAMRVGLQVPTLLLEVDPNGIHAVGIAPRSMIEPHGLKIPTDENGQVRPYFAPHDPDLYFSASDILKQQIDPSRIAGKIAFIGSSAAGLLDIRSTPVSSQIPGVEIHAQLIENSLAVDREKGAMVAANLFLNRSQFVSKGGEIILIAVCGFLMIVLTPTLGATRTLIAFLTLTAGAVAGSWYLFTEKQILMDASFPVFTAFLLYATLTYLHLTREETARRQIRNAFSKYLSPAMVNVIAKHPEQLQLGGQKRELTLLFCDVRGFTTISEQFDAEGLTRLINRLLSPLTDIILRHKGTVDKYMGDCIMAFWNAPLDDPLHARNGCISALKMIEAMGPLNKQLEKEALKEGQQHIPLQVGVGINSGECIVGNMGSDQRFDYSALGDVVNLASRIEGQSKNYGVAIVIGEKTQVQVPMLASIELDLIKVKGKKRAVRIFALLGDEKMAETVEFQALKTAVETTLTLWRQQKWAAARAANAKARELAGPYDMEGFFDLYDQRISNYLANPPETDWDGVFVAGSK